MFYEEHPFAQYVRILGKGRKGSRGLTQEEAKETFRMILNDEVTPEQLGAYLMLMRVKEETPEEVAGAALAIKDFLNIHLSISNLIRNTAILIILMPFSRPLIHKLPDIFKLVKRNI